MLDFLLYLLDCFQLTFSPIFLLIYVWFSIFVRTRDLKRNPAFPIFPLLFVQLLYFLQFLLFQGLSLLLPQQIIQLIYISHHLLSSWEVTCRWLLISISAYFLSISIKLLLFIDLESLSFDSLLTAIFDINKIIKLMGNKALIQRTSFIFWGLKRCQLCCLSSFWASPLTARILICICEPQPQNRYIFQPNPSSFSLNQPPDPWEQLLHPLKKPGVGYFPASVLKVAVLTTSILIHSPKKNVPSYHLYLPTHLLPWKVDSWVGLSAPHFQLFLASTSRSNRW